VYNKTHVVIYNFYVILYLPTSLSASLPNTSNPIS